MSIYAEVGILRTAEFEHLADEPEADEPATDTEAFWYHQGRAEAFAEHGRYQAITARAMDRLAGILAVGGHLLDKDGVLLAMKGPAIQDEIAELPEPWQVLACHRLHVPGLAAERQLVVIGRK